MSDQPMGPDWWMASDHKWYPPELHPSRSSDAQPASASPPAGASTSGDVSAPTDGTVVAEAGEDGWRVGPADDPDRYTLHERHSRGNEGDLWRASLTIDDVEVPIALKVTHPEDVSDLDEAKSRWQRQADLLGSLDHPGLVKVRELYFGAAPHRPGSADDSTTVLCLAMNWAEGDRLDEWVKARPDRTLADVGDVLGAVASALGYLHTGVGGRPVLHRNLKPGNILVADDQVRLVGFGTARLLKLDAQMTIVGTPAWMPPEVLNGDAYDQAADLWSLGAIAYFLFVGSPPPLLSLDKARTQLAGSPLLVDRPDLVDDVVALLDPAPANRPSSPQGWVETFLAHVASPAAVPAPDHPEVAPADPPPADPLPAEPPPAEPVASEADLAPAADAAPALDLSKTDEAVALPPSDPTWSLEPTTLDEAPAEPVASEPLAVESGPAPGEPVWDEASGTWRDPASGSVWDPDTQSWSAPDPAYAAAPPPPDPTPGDSWAAAEAVAANPPPPAEGWAGADVAADPAPPPPSPDPAYAADPGWVPPPGDPAPGAPPPPAGGKSRTPLIIGVVVAILVVIALVAVLLLV